MANSKGYIDNRRAIINIVVLAKYANFFIRKIERNNQGFVYLPANSGPHPQMPGYWNISIVVGIRFRYEASKWLEGLALEKGFRLKEIDSP